MYPANDKPVILSDKTRTAFENAVLFIQHNCPQTSEGLVLDAALVLEEGRALDMAKDYDVLHSVWQLYMDVLPYVGQNFQARDDKETLTRACNDLYRFLPHGHQGRNHMHKDEQIIRRELKNKEKSALPQPNALDDATRDVFSKALDVIEAQMPNSSAQFVTDARVILEPGRTINLPADFWFFDNVKDLFHMIANSGTANLGAKGIIDDRTITDKFIEQSRKMESREHARNHHHPDFNKMLNEFYGKQRTISFNTI